MLQLGAVSFIWETNDVSAIVNQSDFVVFAVTKLLDCANVETAACAYAKFFTKLLTIPDNADFTKAKKFFALSE